MLDLTDSEISRIITALGVLQDIDWENGHEDEAKLTARLINKIDRQTDNVPYTVEEE